MKKNILNSLFILAAITFVSACKPKKEIVVAPPKAETKVDNSKAETLTLLNSKQLKFNTLSLKAKATLDIDGNANDVTMNFRIKDKETIWVSITAIGGLAEVARALITPDSIKIQNKLKSEYLKKPFSYIYGFTNKQITFSLLQSVLSGNTIADFMTEKSALVQENGVWALSGNAGDLAYKSLFNTLLKTTETNLNDAKNAQALKVVYGSYTPINNALFPSSLKINSMSGTKKIDIAIEFVKIESNVPVEFPFSVPKTYEVIN